MDYTQIELDIVSRLAGMPAGVEVLALPETENDMRGRTFEAGRIIVMYSGSRFGDGDIKSRSAMYVHSPEFVKVDVLMQSRFLRTKPFSVYELLGVVRKKLVGFRPSNCMQMFPIKGELLPNDPDRGADEFNYVLSFEAETIAVQDYDEAVEDGALINQITIDSPPGYDQVQVS